jgi:hypothetical protein
MIIRVIAVISNLQLHLQAKAKQSKAEAEATTTESFHFLEDSLAFIMKIDH